MSAFMIWRGVWRHVFGSDSTEPTSQAPAVARPEPKDVDSDSGRSYATCSETQPALNHAARPRCNAASQSQSELTLWRSSMILNPEFSQRYSGKIVAIKDGQQDRCMAVVLSAELFDLMSRAVAGGRELDHVLNEDALLDNTYADWIKDLHQEKTNIDSHYEALAGVAVQQPSTEILEHMALIPRQKQIIDEALEAVDALYRPMRDQTLAKQDEHRRQCQEAIEQLDQTWQSAEYVHPFEAPLLKAPEMPFEERLIGSTARLEKLSERFFGEPQAAESEGARHKAGFASLLLGPREGIRNEMVLCQREFQEQVMALNDFRDIERAERKEAWLEDPYGQTESVFESKMERILDNRLTALCEAEVELDIARRRANFVGLRLDQDGKSLEEEDEDQFLDPEEERHKQEQMFAWLGNVGAQTDPDQTDEEQIDAPDIDDWEYISVAPSDSLTQSGKHPDWQDTSPQVRDWQGRDKMTTDGRIELHLGNGNGNAGEDDEAYYAEHSQRQHRRCWSDEEPVDHEDPLDIEDNEEYDRHQSRRPHRRRWSDEEPVDYEDAIDAEDDEAHDRQQALRQHRGRWSDGDAVHQEYPVDPDDILEEDYAAHPEEAYDDPDTEMSDDYIRHDQSHRGEGNDGYDEQIEETVGPSDAIEGELDVAMADETHPQDARADPETYGHESPPQMETTIAADEAPRKSAKRRRRGGHARRGAR